MNWKRGSSERFCLVIAGLVLVALAATATVTLAQSGGNMERPPHWQVLHPDRNEAVERRFVVMRPGWHIFAGPGALLREPGSFASGNFSVTSKIFLFPTPDMGTPYGLFLGGSEFEGESSTYVSFQIRNDGRFRVAHHAGEQVHELVPWTEHADIVPLEPTDGPVENRLAVDVQDGVVSFFINDAVAAELSDAGLTTDGAIGLAVGGDLSLHVTELMIGPNRPAAGGGDPPLAWSMDRARILFTGSRDGTSDLYVLDRAAGTTRRLTAMGTPEGGANGGQVSPDGSSVAFQVRRGSDYDLYVMDVAGGPPRSVVQHAAYDVNPVWSPDGRRLAFMSTRGFEPGVLGPFPGHIYAVDVAQAYGRSAHGCAVDVGPGPERLVSRRGVDPVCPDGRGATRCVCDGPCYRPRVATHPVHAGQLLGHILPLGRPDCVSLRIGRRRADRRERPGWRQPAPSDQRTGLQVQPAVVSR